MSGFRSSGGRVAACAACVTLVAGVVGCGSDEGGGSAAAGKSDKPFRVLLVVDTTGPFKLYGTDFVSSMKASAGYWNGHGGIDGRKITVENVTTNGDPTQAVTALTKWISANGKPDFVFPGSGGDSAGLPPAVKRLKVLGVGVVDGTDGCGTKAAERCPTFFTPGLANDLAPRAAAKWLIDKGYKNVGLLIEQNPYSDGEIPPLKEALEAGGAKTVSATFQTTAVDVAPQFAKLRDAGVDVVFTAALGAAPGYAARARARLGLVDKLPLVFDPGASSSDITKLAPADTLKNSFQQIHRASDPKATLPGRDLLLKAATAAGVTISQPLLVGAYPWDDMILVKHAVEQAGSSDPVKVSKALENLNDKAASDPLYMLSEKVDFTTDAHRNAAGDVSAYSVIPVAPLKDGMFQSTGG